MRRKEFEALTDYGDWRTVYWKADGGSEFEFPVQYTVGKIVQCAAEDVYVFVSTRPNSYASTQRVRLRFKDIIAVY